MQPNHKDTSEPGLGSGLACSWFASCSIPPFGKRRVADANPNTDGTKVAFTFHPADENQFPGVKDTFKTPDSDPPLHSLN